MHFHHFVKSGPPKSGRIVFHCFTPPLPWGGRAIRAGVWPDDDENSSSSLLKTFVQLSNCKRDVGRGGSLSLAIRLSRQVVDPRPLGQVVTFSHRFSHKYHIFGVAAADRLPDGSLITILHKLVVIGGVVFCASWGGCKDGSEKERPLALRARENKPRWCECSLRVDGIDLSFKLNLYFLQSSLWIYLI